MHTTHAYIRDAHTYTHAQTHVDRHKHTQVQALSNDSETCTDSCGDDAWAHICTKSCSTRSGTVQKLHMERPTDQFNLGVMLPVSGAFVNYGKRSTVMVEMAVDRVNSDGQTHFVMHAIDTWRHTDTYTHTHTHTHTHTNKQMRTHTHTHAGTHIHTHTHTHAHTHTHKSLLHIYTIISTQTNDSFTCILSSS
jgi:hypothetical protein